MIKSILIIMWHVYHVEFLSLCLGLHLEQFVDVSRRELAWEVDYNREANCAKKFRSVETN